MLVGASAGSAFAQDMEVPVEIQLPLFLKVLSFDRLRDQRAETELVVAIAYQRHYAASASAHDDALRVLHSQAVGNRRLRVVSIDVDRDNAGELLLAQHVTVMYVTPLRAIDIAALALVATNAHVTTVTGVVAYVTRGLSVGVRLVGDRPKLVVNRDAARLAGADFSAELLKLVQVVP